MKPAKGDTQSDTQDDTQSDTQDDTQDGTLDKELDDWIEKQIWNNPQILTEDLAKLSNRSSRTIKR